jgi:hypothetical protein
MEPSESKTMNKHIDPTGQLLIPDRDALTEFIKVIFLRADPTGFVSLRAFPNDKGKVLFVEPIALNDPQLIDVVVERARQAAQWPRGAVFCPPICTFKDGKDAKETNIKEGVVLTVECDAAPIEAERILTELLGLPTATVVSGGVSINPDTGEIEKRLHLHWRLKVPTRTAEEHAKLKMARALASKLVLGDSSSDTIVHPLRWPGSWHTKALPFLAYVSVQSGNEIDLDETLTLLKSVSATLEEARQVDEQFAGDKPSREVLEDALDHIPNNNADRHWWLKICGACKDAFGEDGRDLWLKFSSKYEKSDPDEDARVWDTMEEKAPGQRKATYKTLIWEARKNGWSMPDEEAVPVDLWGAFPPPELPQGLLPNELENWAREKAGVMGVDPAALAVMGLVVCAAAIPDHVKVKVKRFDMWHESARLWVGVIGDPSAKKTPAQREAVRPLREIDGELVQKYLEEKAEYDGLDKEEKKSRPRPLNRGKILNDTTVEAAQELLRDNPEGVLCEQDELSGWFGNMDRYNGKGGGDRAFWLQAFNGGSYSVRRVGRGVSQIPNLSVCLLGGIQPDKMREAVSASADDGLIQRLLAVVLRAGMKGRDEKTFDLWQRYNDLIVKLSRLGTAVVTFDDGAQIYREELEERHLELQALETIDKKLATHIAKYDGIFARLALTFHCIETAKTGDVAPVVSKDTAVRAGRFLHEFFLPHSMHFYIDLMGFSGDHDRLGAVASFILVKGLTKITMRDVRRGVHEMRKGSTKDAEEVMNKLCGLGWLTAVERGWTVNPAVHTAFAAKAADEAKRKKALQKVMQQAFSERRKEKR